MDSLLPPASKCLVSTTRLDLKLHKTLESAHTHSCCSNHSFIYLLSSVSIDTCSGIFALANHERVSPLWCCKVFCLCFVAWCFPGSAPPGQGKARFVLSVRPSSDVRHHEYALCPCSLSVLSRLTVVRLGSSSLHKFSREDNIDHLHGDGIPPKQKEFAFI